MIRSFVFSLSFLFFASAAQASIFSMNVVPNDVSLINGTWHKCGSVPSDGDLSSMYFAANRLEFAWDSEVQNQFYLQEVKITVEGSNLAYGKQTFVLNQGELLSMFSGYTEPGSDLIVISSGAADKTACALKVGGIQLEDVNVATTLKAKVQVKGIEVNSAGKSEGAVRATQEITVEYEP